MHATSHIQRRCGAFKKNAVNKIIIILITFFAVNCNQTKQTKMTESKSKFDTEKMTEFAINKITEFAKKHPNETFYGFSIDASLLCFNSEEEFKKTLKYYQEKSDKYNTKERIADLKENTGDWEYQGFAEFDENSGFDWDEYNEHYHEEEEFQLTSDYAKSMDIVVENLKKSGVFDLLKKTENFYANRVEHNY